jgi:hypothetical protein
MRVGPPEDLFGSQRRQAFGVAMSAMFGKERWQRCSAGKTTATRVQRGVDLTPVFSPPFRYLSIRLPWPTAGSSLKRIRPNQASMHSSTVGISNPRGTALDAEQFPMRRHVDAIPSNPLPDFSVRHCAEQGVFLGHGATTQQPNHLNHARNSLTGGNSAG